MRSLLRWRSEGAAAESGALARIQVAELLQAQRQREQTLSLLVHDMNPLSGVISNVEYLRAAVNELPKLDAEHPNALAPGKRPRTTLSPSIASRGGRAFLAFGSPGGDAQDQWALQFLLGVVDFGLSLQQAVELPNITSRHAPASFYPRAAEPGVVAAENRIAPAVLAELAARGHEIHSLGPFSQGNTLAASYDADSGIYSGAASPRYSPAYAVAW